MISLHKKGVCCYGASKLILMLSDYMKPYCYLFFFNTVIIDKRIDILPIVIALYIGLYLLQTFFVIITQYIYNKTFPIALLEIKEKILCKYNELDLKQIGKYNFSDLVTRLQDDSENIVSYYMKIVDIVTGVLIAIVVIVVLFCLNFQMAIICIITMPISCWFTKFISKRNNHAFGHLRKVQISNNAFLFNSIQNWKEIKSYDLQSEMQNMYSEYCEKIGKLYIRTHIYWFVNRTFIAFKDTFLTRMGLYLLGGILIIKGYSEVAILLTFMQYNEKLINQILQLSDVIVKIGKEKESVKNVEEILSVQVQQRRVDVLNEIQQIEIRNVDFAYESNETKILKSINMNIYKGDKVGIVGKSGCGKSTLLKLLSGIEMFSEGTILINSYDIREINQNIFCSKVGIIMQDSYLFNLSIRENLLLAKENATEKEIWNACEKARIKEFILGLEYKLDTVIGERGIRLSGGQRQRLIIARMILYNPEIIFLDEATSALDSENEAIVVGELRKLCECKTLVIVAHNINSIKECNIIYFMEEGQITDYGNHFSLLNSNQNYNSLWGKMQK